MDKNVCSSSEIVMKSPRHHEKSWKNLDHPNPRNSGVGWFRNIIKWSIHGNPIKYYILTLLIKYNWDLSIASMNQMVWWCSTWAPPRPLGASRACATRLKGFLHVPWTAWVGLFLWHLWVSPAEFLKLATKWETFIWADVGISLNYQSCVQIEAGVGPLIIACT